MSSAAETIKERLSIVDVVGAYIKLEKSGSNYKARCPFHNEKTPSFFVSPGRNSYYCFGCSAKGDIFTFVQEFEKVDFIGALKLLAEKAGIELDRFKDENKGEFDRLRSVLEMATKFFEDQLRGGASSGANTGGNKDAMKYLESRGLTEKTIQDWRVGFAPNEWRRLHDYLLTKKVSEADMEKVGLIKSSTPEEGAADSRGQGGAIQTRQVSIYDRFRSRVIFPLFDPSSRVIAYSGRIFGEEEKNPQAPKYLNSPDTVLFNKSDTLYGYHKAKEGIRQWKYAILVEGQMDLLMCHQSGYTNAVATSGTSLTPLHLEKLKKISDNLMLVYDADKAGLKATLRAWTSALALGMDVKVAALPQGEDPASVLLKNKEEFKNALKNSKHIIDFQLDVLSREYKQTPSSAESRDDVDVKDSEKDKERLTEKFKKAVQAEVLPYVAAIDSAIERSNFISRISLQTGIYEPDLKEETDKIRSSQSVQAQSDAGRAAQKSAQSGAGNSSSPTGKSGGTNDAESAFTLHDRMDITARRIAALILWFKSKNEEQKAEKLSGDVLAILPTEDGNDITEYMKSFADELLFEADVLFQGSTRLEQETTDLLYGLEEKTLKERLSKTMMELHLAEKKKDKEKAEKLLAICQEISHKLSNLNKSKRE